MKLKFYSLVTKQVTVLFALLLCTGLLFAQRTISGSVVDDENGEPLIGASILVKGTTTGVITDLNGGFKLLLPEGSDQLEVSYTGYSTKTVDVGAQDNYEIRLSSGTELEEVVVVGYGSVQKKDVTGAISQVGEEDFNKGFNTTPEQLIQGKVSGVQIVGNSGAPGAAATIRIRGSSSVRTNNQPLIVVDGVILDGRGANPSASGVASIGDSPSSNPLSFINPNDIASVEVLKDASATAIFGSRGANGVILITTKKGRSGAPTLDFSASVGASSILKRLEVLDADQYRSALDAEVGNRDNDFGGNVDAFDEILQTAITQNYNLGIGGGNDKGNYRVSASLLDQEGIIRNSGLKKYTGVLNGSYNFFKDNRLKLDVLLNGSYVDEQTAPISDDAGFEGSLIGQALQWNPTQPLIDERGNFVQPGPDVRNPLAFQEYYDDNTAISRIIGSLGATFTIVDGLDYRANYSVNRAEAVRRISVSPLLNVNDIRDRGQAVINSNVLSNEQITHTLNYRKQISSGLSLNALAGYEYIKIQRRGNNMEAQDFAIDADDLTTIVQGAQTQIIDSYEDPTIEIQSFFGRAILNLSDKYIFTGTVRADGSSKFGENNQYGIFPSFAFAWSLHEEAFVPEAFDVLKLRLGFGVTGNQEFPAGSAQERWGYDPENGNFRLENNPNPDLRWETTDQYNLGVDFGFLDYRLTGTVDFFRRETRNLIIQSDPIQPAPNSKFWFNSDGRVINQGVELALNAFLIQNENTTLSVGFNTTYLSNELQDYDGPPILTGEINGQGLTGVNAQRLANGQPLYVFFLREFEGFNEQGLSQFANNGELMFVGNPNPDVLLGFNANLNVSDFDVSFAFNGAFGHQVYNNTANAVFAKGGLTSGRNITEDLLDNGEAISNANAASTRYMEDADFLRLTNATIGYTFNNINADWLQNLRVYVTGTNLLLITGYSGFDPEVNTNKDVNDVPSFGIEYTPFPTARTVLFGVSASF